MTENLVGRMLIPLREVVRARLRRAVRRDPSLISLIEDHVRKPEPNRNGLAFGPLSRLYAAVDPSGSHQLLLRTHRKATKGARDPIWRTFEYKGLTVRFDIRNTAQWNAYMTGRHQPGVSHWLRHYARPGTTALDIGSNAGIFALEMAISMGASGCVHAFEPNPDVHAVLREAVQRNHLEAVIRTHSLALGDTDAMSSLYVPLRNNGAASLSRAHDDEEHCIVETRVERFETWWERQGQPAIDLIKIDVEGHERSVLRGLSRYIRSNRPVIVMEITPGNDDGSAVLAQLREAGYRVRRILADPPYVDELPPQLTSQADVLCEPIPHGNAEHVRSDG